METDAFVRPVERSSTRRSSTSRCETDDRRNPWVSFAVNDGFSPLSERGQQLDQTNSAKLSRTRLQIPPRARHQRTSPHHVSRRMMMQCHRRLNQPLQKALLHPVRLAPHILPNLMRVIEFPRIEMPDPNLILLPKSHPEDSTWRVERVWRSDCRRSSGGTPSPGGPLESSS